MNIAIYIYDNAEVLDFSGPFEVFCTASRICEEEDLFSVFLVGETGELVTARAGFKVIPRYGFHNHPEIDVLIVPGGVHAGEMEKPQVINWISKQSEKASLTASVCTGAFLLAQAKVTGLKKVTTHWDDIEPLRERFPNLDVIENIRWVDEGRIMTSGGISAGIDMSLHIVGKLHSIELAERTARQMEFIWTKNI